MLEPETRVRGRPLRTRGESVHLNGIAWAIEEKQLSERRACRVLGQSRTTQCRELRGKPVNDDAITHWLMELAEANPAWGCPQLHSELRE